MKFPLVMQEQNTVVKNNRTSIKKHIKSNSYDYDYEYNNEFL